MNTKPFLVAVDPGASGGIAWFEPGVGVIAKSMPGTDGELLEILQGIAKTALTEQRRLVALIERVGGYVKPPKVTWDESGAAGISSDSIKVECGQPGSAMFTFGENAGLVRGMLRALGAEIQMTESKAWQAPLFLKKGRRSKTEWKRVLKNAAQRLFPGIKVTLKTADALLILRYGALKYAVAGVYASPAPQKHAGGAPARKAGHSEKLVPPQAGPPEGYVSITTGTTDRFDLIWSRPRTEKGAGRWLPVDALNEHVSEYLAVCRPTVEKVEKLIRARDDLSLHEAVLAGKLPYIVQWKGVPWVAMRNPKTAASMLISRANPMDVLTYPAAPKAL